MKKYIRIVFALTFSLLINLSTATAEDVEINIYSINDFHGALRERSDAPGIALLSGALKDAQAASRNNILVAAGDLFGTTVDAKDTNGMSTVLAFNELGISCIALGNHEFDYDRSILNKQSKAAGFGFLAGNIRSADGRQPFKGYSIIEKDGVKIAFIGMITADTAQTATRKNIQDLEFINPQEILPQYIDLARAKGADIVVLLSHIGSQQLSGGLITDEITEALSADVRNLDAAISAHTHKAVNGKYKDIPVVQAKCYGQMIAHLKINYSKAHKKVLAINHKLLDVRAQRSFIPDTQMSIFIQPYLQAADAKYNTVIATNRQELRNNRFEPSSLANCFADMMQAATGADLVLLNAGAIRKDYLDTGDFTLRNLIDIFPFENYLIVAQISGADIIKALEYGIQHPRYGMLRFAGLQVTYNTSKPQGQRVEKVTLQDGSALQSNKHYKIASIDFLLDGGDGFTMLKSAHSREQLGILSDALAEYIKTANNILHKDDGRLSIIQE